MLTTTNYTLALGVSGGQVSSCPFGKGLGDPRPERGSDSSVEVIGPVTWIAADPGSGLWPNNQHFIPLDN